MKHLYFSFLFLCCALGLSAQDCPPETATPTNNADFTISVLGTYATGVFDESAAEIADFNPRNNRLVFTNADANSIIMLDVSDPANPVLVGEFTPPENLNLDGVNSVGFQDGLDGFYAAFQGVDADSPGAVVLFNADGTFNVSRATGALPDMINTKSLSAAPGRNIEYITANEGEPDDDYLIDPVGSITVQVGDATESITVDFSAFNDQKDDLIARGVRIFGANNPTVAQDLEPEYIAVLGDTAYVICQENNAFGVFDLVTNTFVDLIPFGFKDHSCPANALDASNRDDTINLATYNILGMYQPDAVVPFEKDGAKYLLTANEGDARDYDGFSEEVRVKDLTLDPTAYPDAAALQEDEVLGRLGCTDQLGDTDGDGDFDQIYSYGARSFSIFSVDGTLVWDSGSEFERILADQIPDDFNSNNDENDSFDSRSDDKGPEPEAIAIGTIMERTYAFIGLERVGGIMVYDITDPTAPFFVTYFNNRDFSVPAQLEDDSSNPAAGDLGVEDITFVSAADSPNGSPMLITTNEVSGTVTFFGLGGDLVSVPNIAAEAIELSAFPNPSAGQLNLQFELNRSGRVSYQLYNMNGSQVQGRDLGFRAAGSYQEDVRLEDLPRGAYVLRLFTEEGIASLKVIRQ
jgi:2',3'-cyclic-nucleotide 2'-phosphodiesterase/3'-nucleotidase/5'-nucleotidase